MAASTSAAAAAPPPPPIGRLHGGGGGGGSGGNGALYHVAAVDQGLHLEPETLSYWGYDDGTSTLLVAKGGLVFAYDLSPGVAPGSPEQLRWTFPLADGPPVRALRLSLDGGLLAIQRSPVMLEVVELATGNVFVQGTDRGRGEVLCFFFTELEGADLVMVTPGGLEMLEFVPRRQGLRLRERVRMPVEWALYTHETRMVLLGTAAGGSSYIKAFQFVSSGLVALPPFTAGAAASAIALMGPAAGGAALVAGSPAAAAAVATPPARVTADCLRLIKVYGRVYCAHINRRSLKLELYRFYTDTVVLQHTYELFSPHVELAVVDSVIVAHCCTAAAAAGGGGVAAAADGAAAAAAGVAMLFDVAAPTLQPIANPLPLRTLRHGTPPEAAEAEADAAADAAATAAAGNGNGGGCKPHWEYLAPNLVLDRGSQTVYRLALNLPAVAESCSDPAVLVGFLQRRRGPTPSSSLLPPLPQGAAAAAAAAQQQQQQQPSPKALLMSVVRNALQERMPLPTIRAIFEDLCAGYAAALDREPAQPPAAPAAAAAGAAAAAAAPAAPTAVPMPQYVTADEVASELFRWLHDEEVVDAPYLQAALWEYMSAAFAAGIPLPPYLQELSVEVLLQQSQEGQVLQLLYSQADHVGTELATRILAAAPRETTTTQQQQQQQQQPPVGDADADAPGGGGGGTPAGALSPQLGMDLLARAALPARYEPVAGGAAAAAAAAAAGGGGSNSGGGDAAAYVEALLAAGEVLRAARVMRRYRVSRPSVKEFIAAVGARGDEAALAAVYRTFQDELLASYPKYELAARKLLRGGAPAAATAPASAVSAA